MNPRPTNLEIYRRGFLALLVAAYYCAFCWRPEWMGLLGVEPLGVWFLDTHAVLAASDAHALGINPADQNPLDYFHQPHAYSHWWFALDSIGLSRVDYLWLGALLGFVFLGVALLQVGVRTRTELFISAVALTAPCIMLGFNRGNADLLVFIVLVATVPCLLSSHAAVRWIALASILFATGLKFYPALAGIVLLAPTRSRRETLVQLTVFAVLLLALGLHQLGDLQRYAAVELRPEGFFTFGAGIMPRLLSAPAWVETVFPWGLAVVAIIFWWRVAPSYHVPAEHRADYLRFILGAALLTGCYLMTVNYAYRRVFSIFMLPFLWWAWNASGWPAWFRRLGRFTAVVLVLLLWVDGLSCLFINLSESLSTAEINLLTDRLLLAQQPFVAAERVGLLAFLVPFVRDALHALRTNRPSEMVAREISRG